MGTLFHTRTDFKHAFSCLCSSYVVFALEEGGGGWKEISGFKPGGRGGGGAGRREVSGFMPGFRNEEPS